MSKLRLFVLICFSTAFASIALPQAIDENAKAAGLEIRTDETLPLLPNESVGQHVSRGIEMPPLNLSSALLEVERRHSGESLSVLPASSRLKTAEACDGCAFGSCQIHGQRVSNKWTPVKAIHRRLQDYDLSQLTFAGRFRAKKRFDRGIGYERVMFAPNVLDTAIQRPHIGFRYQIDSGLKTPDRAEYFWGSPGFGPDAETSVNTQDLTLRMAVGNDKAMALTSYTLRSLDPDLAANTTGMGDMMLGAQALLMDGKRLKLATIVRTYIATGPADRGLGTGHNSMEYGLLARHCWSPETYFFGEFKYWNPLKAAADIGGDVMTTGFGVSTIAAESDVFAFIPTLEMRTLTFLFGGQTEPDGTVTGIDGDTAVEIYPGARFVLGPQTDAGLCEFGCAAGITFADSNWFDTRWVFDLRFSR